MFPRGKTDGRVQRTNTASLEFVFNHNDYAQSCLRKVFAFTYFTVNPVNYSQNRLYFTHWAHNL